MEHTNLNKIIFASNNQGKIAEIKKILKNYEVIGLKEADINIDIEENGKTFTANSLIKVRAISKYIKDRDRKLFDGIILADDSGLCVDALDGFPGVETHRFLGKDATDEQRNEYILEQLKEKTGLERSAEFITSISVVKSSEIYHSTGVLKGIISDHPRGTKGFGFDSIFEVIYESNMRTYNGRYSGKTLAEIPSKEKNRISPRTKAIKKLITFFA